MENPNITQVIHCPSCDEEVHPADFNGETEQCLDCHATIPFDECGCQLCYDNWDSMAADAYDRAKAARWDD